MLIDNLHDLPDEFKEGYRGILLLHRNKDGCEGNAQRKAFKRISSNKKEWMETVQHFKEMKEYDDFRDHRIYSSVNPRNMDKAIRFFKERQLEADYDKNENHHGFYTDITNRFFSAFMNPRCAENSLFLLDCDCENDYMHAMRKLPPDSFCFEYKTKNGRHIITKPFNPALFDIMGLTKTELKKDALIAIA